MRPRSTLLYIHRSYHITHTHVASLEGLGRHEEAIEDDTRAEPEAAQDGRPLAMSALEQHVREERCRCHHVGSPAGDVAAGARAQRGAGAQGEGARARSKGDGAPAAQGHHTRSAGRAAGRALPASAASSCQLMLCLRALDREGVPGAPRARGGATASSP